MMNCKQPRDTPGCRDIKFSEALCPKTDEEKERGYNV
jgi:hypothetical protein